MRSAVEARRHRRHLVASAIVDAVVQGAGTETLDTLLQRFEPARQPAHDRKGAQCNGHEQQHQHQHQPRTAPPRRPERQLGRRIAPRAAFPACAPCRAAQQAQRAAVVKLDCHRARRRAAVIILQPAAVGVAVGNARAVGRVERQRHAQALRPLLQGRRLFCDGGLGTWQAALDQLAPGGGAFVDDGVETPALLLDLALEDPARRQREQR
jgi:hypothetical protein